MKYLELELGVGRMVMFYVGLYVGISILIQESLLLVCGARVFFFVVVILSLSIRRSFLWLVLVMYVL
jgi:hypothetical protein